MCTSNLINLIRVRSLLTSELVLLLHKCTYLEDSLRVSLENMSPPVFASRSVLGITGGSIWLDEDENDDLEDYRIEDI